jgi:hypothetical protein
MEAGTFKEKEVYLRQYYLLTEGMLEALVHGREEELLNLLEQRETCINAIDQLDQAEGAPLMNEQIKKQLEAQRDLEKVVRKHLQQKMQRLTQQMRSVKKETIYTKQYEESPAVSKGVFYDIKS